jgi:hypothetical protein
VRTEGQNRRPRDSRLVLLSFCPSVLLYAPHADRLSRARHGTADGNRVLQSEHGIAFRLEHGYRVLSRARQAGYRVPGKLSGVRLAGASHTEQPSESDREKLPGSRSNRAGPFLVCPLATRIVDCRVAAVKPPSLHAAQDFVFAQPG